MKYSQIFLTIAVAILSIGCSEQNPPEYSNSSSKTNSNYNVNISFTYILTEPFTYSFENTSTGASNYKWDFGDGNSASTFNATHKYSSEGTYTVTLTGSANGNKFDYRKKITVKKPSIYIAGYTLYAIPVVNRYYKVKCVDDDWFGTDWGFTTAYTPLLSNSDIPYTAHFNSPLLMDKLNGDNYYTFYVYYSSSTSNSSGTQCLKKKLQKTDILKYKNEHILISDNGKTKIGILMEYK